LTDTHILIYNVYKPKYIFWLHLCMRNIGLKYTNVVLLRRYFELTLYSLEKVCTCTLYCTN
jgi:hypothetical protein